VRETLAVRRFGSGGMDYEWPVIGPSPGGGGLGAHPGFGCTFLGEKKPVDLRGPGLQSPPSSSVLQIDVDPPMPWQLNLARVLAPVVAAYTALQALGELFAGQIRSACDSA